jgi:hypothetical protein
MSSRANLNACRYKAAALVTFVAVASLAFVLPRREAAAAAQRRTPVAQRGAGVARRGSRRDGSARPSRRDYSNFSHRVAEHQRQACDSCHKFPSPDSKEIRQGDEAFPDITQYPAHASCLDCHRRQFFARERPHPRICLVCHAAATPRDQTRHPFPNPPAAFDASAKGRTHVSDFRINFPHDKHLELFSRGRPPGGDAAREGFVSASFRRAGMFATQESDPKSCATCHQTYRPQNDSDEEFVTAPPKDLPEGAFWLKKGTFKTVPRDHSTCFTCHSVDGGIAPAPSDCAACHKLPPEPVPSLTQAHDDFDPKSAATMNVNDKLTLELWGRRDAARFRHEWPPHDLACTTCHEVAAMNTLDEATKKVPVMSCGGGGTGCHVEPTSEGVLNLAVARKRAEPTFQCTKCHVNNGRLPLPETHLRAVAPPQTN